VLYRGLNAEGQRSEMQSPAAWVVAEGQSVEASNLTIWIMRMTDLAYIHLDSEVVETDLSETMIGLGDWTGSIALMMPHYQC
jgi:hypothetical protein